MGKRKSPRRKRSSRPIPHGRYVEWIGESEGVPLMATTIFHEYGKDWQRSPSGNILLAKDDPNGEATAATQRLMRIILTTPRLFDDHGIPVARADDKYNPTFGAGLPAYVDENVNDAVLGAMRAAILGNIAIDPYFVSVPQPTVKFQQQDANTLLLWVRAVTTSGQVAATPALPLSVGG